MRSGARTSRPAGFVLEGKRRRSALSMAPLIDFTFILLIFFMVVTQFDRFTPVDVSVRKSPGRVATPPSAQERKPRREILHLVIHENGDFLLNGERIGDVTTFAAALARHGPGKDAGTQERPLLLVEPRENVSVQLLIDALGALRNVPGFAVRIVAPGTAGERPAAELPSDGPEPAPTRTPPPFMTTPRTTEPSGGRP